MQKYALVANDLLLALASYTMPDHTGWTLIETDLDLSAPMVDENGAALYKMADGSVTARTEAERAEMQVANSGCGCDADRITSLEQQLALLLGGDTE